MRDLRPLIRLHQRQVDERRRELAEKLSQLDGVRAERQRFEELFIEERRMAASDLLLAVTLPAFLARAKQMRESYDRQEALLQREAEQAEELVTEAFRELKKFEQVQQMRDEARVAERKYRETQMFDEVASTRFQRAQDGEGG